MKEYGDEDRNGVGSLDHDFDSVEKSKEGLVVAGIAEEVSKPARVNQRSKSERHRASQDESGSSVPSRHGEKSKSRDGHTCKEEGLHGTHHCRRNCDDDGTELANNSGENEEETAPVTGFSRSHSGQCNSPVATVVSTVLGIIKR